MKQFNEKQRVTLVEPKQQKQAWIKPAVQKIRAGDAEVGTRSAADGTFTTS
jgi:hypothetical protein